MLYAVDTSSLIAYLDGETGRDTALIAQQIVQMNIAVCPVVIVEALSNLKTRHLVEQQLRQLYVLTTDEEFWFRASLLRARVLAKGYKAGLADTLIAQACIDHAVPLITRDTDFRHFSEHGGLQLAA